MHHRPSGVEVRRVVLTASGGPFREWSAEQLARATVEDALRHPTWRMGRKITIDSATLANKALEVIEAHFLFGLPYDRIEVVVHPQSVVHSFVEFIDGSVRGADERAEHGAAGAVCADASGTGRRRRCTAVRSGQAVSADLRARGSRAVSGASTRHRGRRGAAARRRRCSTPRTNARWPPFSPARSASATSRAASASALDSLGGVPAGTREQLLAADAAARRHVQEMFGC